MMFWQTYKNTLKTVFRSALFWVCLVTALVLIIYYVMLPHYNCTDFITGREYTDLDPAFVLKYDNYLDIMSSGLHTLNLKLFVPLICVVTTFLVVRGDYSNGFYEVEKAGGVRPATYFFGRLAALFTLNCFLAAVFSAIRVHLYIATRVLPEGMTLDAYLADSSVRLMRGYVYTVFPCAIFYVTLTYMVGCLTRSGIGAAVGGIGYMSLYYLLLTTGVKYSFPEWVERYAPPASEVIQNYICRYGRRIHEEYVNFYRSTLPDATLAYLIVVGCGVAFMTVGYIIVRRRTK